MSPLPRSARAALVRRRTRPHGLLSRAIRHGAAGPFVRPRCREDQPVIANFDLLIARPVATGAASFSPRVLRTARSLVVHARHDARTASMQQQRMVSGATVRPGMRRGPCTHLVRRRTASLIPLTVSERCSGGTAIRRMSPTSDCVICVQRVLPTCSELIRTRSGKFSCYY
jgi:hypothetical protein